MACGDDNEEIEELDEQAEADSAPTTLPSGQLGATFMYVSISESNSKPSLKTCLTPAANVGRQSRYSRELIATAA